MKSLRTIVAAGILAWGTVLTSPAAQAEDTLYLFNWTEYMSPEIIKQFEAKYHCKVVQSYYNSLGGMLAKLKAGGDSQYDVVVPSDYFIPRLIHEGLLMKLDPADIPNLKNFLPQFKSPSYDPNNAYSVPYQWGTTGIAYNDLKIKNPPASWGILFDPKVNPDYPFSMMGGSGMETVGAACAYLGDGFSCKGEKDWVAAAKLLAETEKRKNFTGFQNGTPALHQLESGILSAAMVYNGDFAYGMAKDPKAFAHLKFILPKEGAHVWVDNMAIPAHAPHPKLAMEFINFILDPKVGAELSNYNHYASPNAASKPYLDPVLKSPLITPTAAEWKRLHYLPAIMGKDLQTYDQIWTAVRAQ
ncbi:MAG: ABC transporter substrate-binding protein [Acidithiobacillus sp.]